MLSRQLSLGLCWPYMIVPGGEGGGGGGGGADESQACQQTCAYIVLAARYMRDEHTNNPSR